MTQPVCQGLAGARPGCGRPAPLPQSSCRKRRNRRAWAGKSVGCDGVGGVDGALTVGVMRPPSSGPSGHLLPVGERGTGRRDRAMWAVTVPLPAVGNQVGTSVAAASPVFGSRHRAARACVSRRRTRRRTKPSAGHRRCRCRVAARGVAGRRQRGEGTRGRCRRGGSGAARTSGAGRMPRVLPAGRAFRVRAYGFRSREGFRFAMRSWRRLLRQCPRDASRPWFGSLLNGPVQPGSDGAPELPHL